MAEWIVHTPGNPATEVRFVSSRSCVLFPFGILDCVCYVKDFVISRFFACISRFCSIHFALTLAGLKNIVRYTKDFVI